MRGLLAEDDSTLLTSMSMSNGFLLAGLPIPRCGTVACSAFVSITVARQLGNCTPFRFIIPGLWINFLHSYRGKKVALVPDNHLLTASGRPGVITCCA